MEQCVPKRRQINFRRRGITQKITCNIIKNKCQWGIDSCPKDSTTVLSYRFGSYSYGTWWCEYAVTFLCRNSLIVSGLAEEENERTNINLTFLIETSRDVHFLLFGRPLATDQYKVCPGTGQFHFFFGGGDFLGLQTNAEMFSQL